jgi:hypothetical protein
MPKAWTWVLWRAKNRGLRSRAVSITGVSETIGGGQPPRPGKKPRLWDRGAFEEKGRKIAKGVRIVPVSARELANFVPTLGPPR